MTYAKLIEYYQYLLLLLYLAKRPQTLKVKLLSEDATLPSRGKSGDAGLDIYAAEDVILLGIQPPRLPPTITKVKTGIAVEIPKGKVGLIWDRSSLGSKLIKTFGGVVDSGYRSELLVCLSNFGYHDYQIKRGDRIAQLIIQDFSELTPEVVDELSSTERGSGGFGSTGV